MTLPRDWAQQNRLVSFCGPKVYRTPVGSTVLIDRLPSDVYGLRAEWLLYAIRVDPALDPTEWTYAWTYHLRDAT